MASILSYVPLVNRLVTPRDDRQTVNLPPVEVHSVEANPDKRPRTLKHLLKANHVNHSILYHNLQFDNHLPHILCSAYHLGAESHHLYHIYDEESKSLEPWKDSPAPMAEDDWRDYLGDKRYQRAFVDFFEDVLAMNHAYDWKGVIKEYMLKGDEPLVNCLIGGRMLHPRHSYPLSLSNDHPPIPLTSPNSRPPPYPPWLRLRIRQPRNSHGSPRPRRNAVQLPAQIQR
jgi:hypothetical protein